MMVISEDDTGSLEPGQWSFYLDNESLLFREQMGPYWSGMTWKVALAKNGRQKLCELVTTWKPNVLAWKCAQIKICR